MACGTCGGDHDPAYACPPPQGWSAPAPPVPTPYPGQGQYAGQPPYAGQAPYAAQGPYAGHAPYAGTPYGHGAPSVPRQCFACWTPVIATATVCPNCGTMLGSPRSKGTAVLLAVFLSFWTWVYTYKTDAAKFWIGLVVGFIGGILTVVFVGFLVILGIWLWAIIDAATKSEQWYQQYPNAKR